MNTRADSVNAVHRAAANLWWPVVSYAVFDVILTWLRTRQFVADALTSEISLIRTPLSLMGDALLLLAATLSARFDKWWTHLAAVVFSVWLLFRGVQKWSYIASALDVAITSPSVISYWFSRANGGWDFPRLVLGLAVLVYAIIAMSRPLSRSP
jgi:hypothetical protein